MRGIDGSHRLITKHLIIIGERRRREEEEGRKGG